MADWDWGSSDIGSGSSGGFSGDDYYWTGGKFSDWSGKSAGKFDSGNRYSSYDSDDGYGRPTGLISERVKNEWIENEKKYGLPQNASDIPKFLTTFGLIWRTVCFYIPIALFALMSWVYASGKWHIEDSDFTMGIITCLFVLPTLVYLFITIDNWYPRPCHLTKAGLHRFLIWQDWLKLSCSLMSLMLILTPLWRYLADGYFEELYNMEEHYWHHYEHFELKWFHNIGMVFFSLIAIAPFVSVVFNPLSSNKSINRRWEYMRYKMGQLDEAEKERLEKIADLKKQLETKQQELIQLTQQILVLKNKQSI